MKQLLLCSQPCFLRRSGLHAQDWAKTKLEKSPRHQEWVKLKHGDREVNCFVVYPEVKDKATTIVLIHEIFGLTDWAREMADELAAEGYIVIAPDLLYGSVTNGGTEELIKSGGNVAAERHILVGSAVLIFAAGKHSGRRFQIRSEFRTHRQFFSFYVVNSNSNEMLPVPESLHNSPESTGRPALQERLHCFLEAFREDLRPSFKVGPQSSFFGSNLAAGNYKRDQRDGYSEDRDQAKAKLHYIPLSVCGKLCNRSSAYTFQ